MFLVNVSGLVGNIVFTLLRLLGCPHLLSKLYATSGAFFGRAGGGAGPLCRKICKSLRELEKGI